MKIYILNVKRSDILLLNLNSVAKSLNLLYFPCLKWNIFSLLTLIKHRIATYFPGQPWVISSVTSQFCTVNLWTCIFLLPKPTYRIHFMIIPTENSHINQHMETTFSWERPFIIINTFMNLLTSLEHTHRWEIFL